MNLIALKIENNNQVTYQTNVKVSEVIDIPNTRAKGNVLVLTEDANPIWKKADINVETEQEIGMLTFDETKIKKSIAGIEKQNENDIIEVTIIKG